jgi:DNA polymerase-3 subunit delta'
MNPSTEKSVRLFINNPSSAVVLIAKNGSGKGTIAKYIIDSVKTQSGPLIDLRDLIIIGDNTDKIAIDDVRYSLKNLAYKAIDSKGYSRFVVIEHAERLASDSQNMILKTVEEPPENTMVILTIDSKNSLLPTLLSRLTQINIGNIDSKNLKKYLIDKGFEQKDVDLAMLASSNRIGETFNILSGDNGRIDSLKRCKNILSMSKMEKLVLINNIYKDRSEVSGIINDLLTISRASLENASKNHSGSSMSWSNIVNELLTAKNALNKKANAKLVLTKLFLEI